MAEENINKSVADLIKKVLGETEGQLLIDKILAAKNTEELEKIAEQHKSVAGVIEAIAKVIVWSA